MDRRDAVSALLGGFGAAAASDKTAKRTPKEILLVLDNDKFSRAIILGLLEALKLRGYDALALIGPSLREDFQIFDLSNLPKAEIEQIRSLIRDA